LIVCAVVALAVPTIRAAEHTTDTPEQVKKAVAEGKAVLIDVREAKEWDAGHLKDAKSLPLSALKAGVPAEELEKLIPAGKVVYLHCAAGARCLTAADLLRKAGRDVRALKPGYRALLDSGFTPAEK
jgi:rhodanese-related sulfurtransferase